MTATPQETLRRAIGSTAANTPTARFDTPLNVKWFGAKGDGVTDDTAAIQAAINASALYSNVLLPVGGEQSVGGGSVLFPQTAAGYKITANINVTNTKILIQGPAKLILSAGVTGFAFQYSGSTSHTGCVIKSLDFIGGSIGISVGDQAVAIPACIYNCMFVNQSTAGIKVGKFGYGSGIRDNLFTGCNYGVWMNGEASDCLLIDHNVFIYNSNYDVFVENNNTFTIRNNEFVGNQKAPASSAANIFIEVGTSTETGAYSSIIGNKFGQEGREEGNCIVFSGSSGGTVTGVVIDSNLLHFESTASGVHAVKADGVEMRGVNISRNSLTYCDIIDTSTSPNKTRSGYVSIKDNVFITDGPFSQLARGNFEISDLTEPSTTEKKNILRWSRYVNSGADFTYTNATPTYMASPDENGVANNATAVLATASNNVIRIDAVETNNQQKNYTLSLWANLSAPGNVLLILSRVNDYAIYTTITIGTSWQRITIPFYQTYLASGNPFAFDVTIPNGATITLGGVCCVPGKDAGDLRRSDTTIEISGLGIYAASSPSAGIYWNAGAVAKNSAPSVGQPKGWVCTVAGNPGTWVSEGNL